MSASGGGDIVHGAGVPSPPWWRLYRDAPLIILAIASLVAAIVGWTVQANLDRAADEIAPVTPAPSATPAAAADACRPTAARATGEPWVEDASAAQQAWAAHADELAGPVVLGQEGWAFYNDQIEENFSQSVGRRLLTVSEVAAWRDYFTPLSVALAEQGIELTIQITPSAASVYPEQLPEWVVPLRGSTPLDQLLSASPDLPIIDFRADLREAAAEDAVFTPVNSHWTDWGGYIGWQSFARCQAAMYPDAPAVAVPAVDRVTSEGVFNEYAAYGVADATPEWTAPVFAEEMAPVEVTDGASNTLTSDGGQVIDLSRLPASTVTDGAWSGQSALILRDSMGNALSGLWAQQYAQTWQIQHRYDDWSDPPNYRSLVEQYEPDVVIIQLAERHLVNAPAKGVTTGY